MSESPEFDAAQWRNQCAAIYERCQQKAMTSMHFSLLLSQSIEDALRAMPLEVALDAIHIARQFDYETSSEVAEMVRWVSDNAHCRHGVQWRDCNDACNKACSHQQNQH